jgi:uncharacterized protein (DUF305 family)
MHQKPILYGIIGVLAGSLLTIVFATNAVNNNNADMMRMMGMRQHVDNMIQGHEEDHEQEAQNMKRMSIMEGMMENMNMSLKGKTGDAFDKAFIEEMVVHHQGAIDMAQQAKINAKHEELKKLADDIITAQTKEIDQMKQWQKLWGY